MPRSRLSPLLALLSATLLLASCAAKRLYDPAAVNGLMIGRSTYDDAVTALGPPSSVTKATSGSRSAVWYFELPDGTVGPMPTASFIFGPDGRILRKTVSGAPIAGERRR